MLALLRSSALLADVARDGRLLLGLTAVRLRQLRAPRPNALSSKQWPLESSGRRDPFGEAVDPIEQCLLQRGSRVAEYRSQLSVPGQQRPVSPHERCRQPRPHGIREHIGDAPEDVVGRSDYSAEEAVIEDPSASSGTQDAVDPPRQAAE
jgi:hypothetical protein